MFVEGIAPSHPRKHLFPIYDGGMPVAAFIEPAAGAAEAGSVLEGPKGVAAAQERRATCDTDWAPPS